MCKVFLEVTDLKQQFKEEYVLKAGKTINLQVRQKAPGIKMEEPRNFFSAPNLSWGFPGRSVGKESTCNAGDLGLIPGLGRFPGERNGYKIVFWPAKFHGLCSPWDHKESDMTERLSLTYPEAFAYAKSPKFEC